MNQIRNLIDRVIEVWACLVIAVMLFVSNWQIVSRYVFRDPITFSEEFLRYALVWLSLVGLAYANGKSAHIALDLLRDQLPATRRRLEIFAQLILVLFAAAVMIGGGSRAMSLAAEQVSPVLGISMAWVYLALPVSGVLTILYSALNIFAVPSVTSEAARASAIAGENHAA
ncbi:MAG: TRAP transporter small permease [Rhodocyclaceae bacterium]